MDCKILMYKISNKKDIIATNIKSIILIEKSFNLMITNEKSYFIIYDGNRMPLFRISDNSMETWSSQENKWFNYMII